MFARRIGLTCRKDDRCSMKRTQPMRDADAGAEDLKKLGAV
jgi:hypothetical protein